MSVREEIERRLERYRNKVEASNFWQVAEAIIKCSKIVREEFERAEQEPSIPVSVVEAALAAGRLQRDKCFFGSDLRAGMSAAVYAIEAVLRPHLLTATPKPPKPDERWRLRAAPGFVVEIGVAGRKEVFAKQVGGEVVITDYLDGFTDRWERVGGGNDD